MTFRTLASPAQAIDTHFINDNRLWPSLAKMDFVIYDNQLFASYLAEVGKIYFLPEGIFPGLKISTSGKARLSVIPTDGGHYLTVLESVKDEKIWVNIPVLVRVVPHFAAAEEGKTELSWLAKIQNTLPSGATLEGSLKCKPEPIPLCLKKGDKVFNLRLGKEEHDPIIAVVLDFSAALTGPERSRKHHLEGKYHKCIGVPDYKELDAEKKIGHYFTPKKKPLGIYPCSLQIEEEEYGTAGAKKLNCHVALGISSQLRGKNVSVLVRLPSANKHFTSANHIRGYDGHFYSVEEVTFGTDVIEQFTVTLIEL